MVVRQTGWNKKKADLLIVILIILVFAGLFFWVWWGNTRSAGNQLPDVTMNTIQGQAYPLQKTNGRVRLLEFIYTHCPDVCPVTTMKMVELQEQLKKQGLFGTKVEFVTITIDPENDTPEILEEYAERLKMDRSGWTILRGTESQTKEVTQALQFYSEKVDGGLISHSTITYLVDENNNIREKFGMGASLDTSEILSAIDKLVGKGS
jgi:protein SCO1/2